MNKINGYESYVILLTNKKYRLVKYHPCYNYKSMAQ
jgi:hypothetical protein